MLLSSHSLTVSSPAIPLFLGVPALEPVRSCELTKEGGNSAARRSNHTSQRTRQEVSQWELLANRQDGQGAYGRDDEIQAQGLTR